MKKGFFLVLSLILSFMMLFSAACVKLGTDTVDKNKKDENADKESESDTTIDVEIQTETDSQNTESETESETQSETQTETQTETETETQTEKVTETEKDIETKRPKTINLKIASYNIFHGEKAGYDYSKIAKNITDNGIEIVGLQEVDNNTKRCGKVNQIQKIAEKAGYQYYKFFKAINHDGGEYGLGIISKYPILTTNLIKLSSGSAEQRILAHAKIKVDGEIVNFFVTHLSYDEEGGGTSRSKQFSEVATELAKHDNFVLTGDFNTRDLTEYNVIKGSALVNNSTNTLITYPDGRSPLDNIVYSTSKWKFGAGKLITNSYSDHYAIYSQAIFYPDGK